MNQNSKIFIAGHDGMVGSAILRNLRSAGFTNIITKKYSELNLIRQEAVESFFAEFEPEYVIDAAAKVGGILANNTFRAQFIYENMMIQNNLIHISHEYSVKKLLFLGSSCIYPKHAEQPLVEEALLTGELEETNEPYALAKITGIKMCESYYRQYGNNFISVMPTNLYGNNDNFDLNSSHVIPALIRKIYEAKKMDKKSVVIWGTGKPMREFLHVDDMAAACIFIMQNVDAKNLYDEFNLSHLNIGTGEDIKIRDLALLIRKVIGYSGELQFDLSKPDGTPRKLLDVRRINTLGWKHSIELENGIRKTYEWFIENKARRG